MAQSTGNVICGGTINTEAINAAHTQIKTIVDAYAETNQKVNAITGTVRENWVGNGRDAFESQYELLISKIEDFGDTLIDIYDALVEAEASYEDQDNSISRQFITTQGE